MRTIKRKKHPTCIHRGSSILEVLIATAILTLGISAASLLSFANQTLKTDITTNTEALTKASSLLEAARADAEKDFNLVNPLAPTLDDVYTKELDVDPIDFFTKKITSLASWTGEGGRALRVSLSTLVVNPDGPGGGDTCDSVLAGDWTNPQKTEYEFGADILEDTSSGFPITSVQSYQHKLYVTVNNDNGNNDGTFFILDITDPGVMPVPLKELDNNPAVGAGLNDVAVDGTQYAYVANAYGANFTTCANPNGLNKSCGQLQVVDMSVSPPSIVYTMKIPGVTGSGGQGVGTRVFYKNGIVYLGLAKATGPEFHIIDVGGGGTPGAAPATPKHMGSYEINNGVNAIFVRDGYLYVASPHDEELKIFDMSDLAAPALVGGFDAPGGGGNNGNGKSFSFVGGRLYFGRTLLDGNEFYILNSDDPETNLPVLGSKDIRNASNNNTSVNGIIIRDYLAFLITNEQFQIWRIDNPDAITVYANPLTLPPGSGGGLQGTAADCEGNYIFVGSQSSNDKGYISVITAGP